MRFLNFVIFFTILILNIHLNCINCKRLPWIQSPVSYYSSIKVNEDLGNNTKILYYNQTLDHFNFQNNKSFQQRYIINDQYWNQPQPGDRICKGPILLYTGGEGDITWFYQNTEFVTVTLAQEMQGLVLFIEHRYYGETMPFGGESGEKENLIYLSIEQAMADYAQLIIDLLEQLNASHCPVLAFGGSYSGMVAAYFRMKYPNVVDGALAASSPILYIPGLVDPEEFNVIITNDFKETSSDGSCSALVLKSLYIISNTTSENFQSLSETLKLCDDIQSEDDMDNLINWIESGLTYMSNCDYPYPSNFFEPLPGNPVNYSCSILNEYINADDDQLIEGFVKMLSVYYNYTGQSDSCFNTSIYVNPALSANNFNYQSCTEMLFPFSSNGVQDMFPPSPFNLTQINEYCQESFGVIPNPQWTLLYYGGNNFQSSNIIFSNGVRDGWLAGGVLTNQTENKIYSIIIKDAPHHLDLRLPNPLDPSSVIEARAFETEKLYEFMQIAALKKQLPKPSRS